MQRLRTQGQAAELLGLSVRQVRRLIAGIRARGDTAVVHALRGPASIRAFAGNGMVPQWMNFDPAKGRAVQ